MNKRNVKIGITALALTAALLSSCGQKGNSAQAGMGDLALAEMDAGLGLDQGFGINSSPVPAASPMPNANSNDGVKVGDELPVSRAMAAKMLSLAYSDKNSIDTMDRMINFTDTTADKWYDRYINAAVSEGLMSGGGSSFLPESPLTVEQAQILLDKLDPKNTIKMKITEDNKNKPISYALWTDLYMQLLNNLSGDKSIEDNFGITQTDVIILITPDNNQTLKKWNVITAGGPLTAAGFHMKDYIDKSVNVLLKDGEIVAIMGIADDTPIINNAYISFRSPNTITVFSGGAERTYSYNTGGLPEGNICNIQINGTTGEKVEILGEKINGVVKKISSSGIEMEDKGVIPTDRNFKVYSLADGAVKWKSPSAITVGADIGEFVIKDGNICAAVILRKAAPENIRVVLGTTGFKGYIHDSVEVTSNKDFTVKAGNTIKNMKAGEIFYVSSMENSDLLGVERLTVTPSAGGKIGVNTIKRNWPDSQSPQYRGILEISRQDGGYLVVNEVNFEEYLYAVVPSEMPTGHGLETAKAQAVTARNYAYNQYYANRFYQYGGNVDDSVSCQVYNNIPENDTSIRAVQETAGEYLSYKGDIVNVYFFSTSAGVTADSGDVWSHYDSGKLPNTTPEYLKSTVEYTEGDYRDLSAEQAAYAFFKNTKVKGYDSSFPWFRWNVAMTGEELSNTINANIAARYKANKKLVKTFDKTTGIFRSMPIETIGKLLDMEVVSRGKGGNIMELKLTGSQATVLVKTEYNIRNLLRPAKQEAGSSRDIVVERATGSSVANTAIMPSAFFVFDKETGSDGQLTSVTFYGGGNGHGVGMSQNGAKGLADAGYDYKGILLHYYPGTEIVKY